jgi:hypothetical protein
MRRLLPVLALLAWLGGGSARAGQIGPGPQAPIGPRAGQTDDKLYARAVELQAQMWRHLSPEGLLVVRHRRGADGADLSHDALDRSDAAMWTGCYAAAQACRWRVTHDPDALAEVRFLARGLKALSDVTGVRGRLARNLGRPQRQPAGENVVPSPALHGLWFRPDVSRDQLAGVVLGWTLIGRFVDDPALRALAADQLEALAVRLYDDGMWLRDYLGRKTKYGELRADVPLAPFLKNGPLAAVGFATVLAASDLNPRHPRLQAMVARLDKRGWDDALPSQFTFLPDAVHGSNVNMVSCALLPITLSLGKGGRYAHLARKGMRTLRAATVGWWNAGLCALYLLGGLQDDRWNLRAEFRVTLHDMPDERKPRRLVRAWYERDKVAPIWMRQVSSWHWTNDVTWFHQWAPAGEPGAWLDWTGADWLFAYWLGRAAGEFTPLVGPGAHPREDPIQAERPAWTR